jgi:hypothetical protein
MPPPEKVDLYKEHREEYVAPRKPVLLTVGPATYLAIEGQGTPGGKEFTDRIGALYAAAYTMKMESKFSGGRDYAVSKLEALWWGPRKARRLIDEPPETWRWKLLIRTPDFITKKRLQATAAKLVEKRKPEVVREVRLEEIDEGRCVQALHVGPYRNEEETIAVMEALAREKGLHLAGLHHEIYLSDPRRVPEARLRTILRRPVR